jgi:hypothetical protein
LYTSLGHFAESHAVETTHHDIFAKAGIVVFDEVTDCLVGVFDKSLVE